jgi:hypothetical protein
MAEPPPVAPGVAEKPLPDPAPDAVPVAEPLWSKVDPAAFVVWAPSKGETPVNAFANPNAAWASASAMNGA